MDDPSSSLRVSVIVPTRNRAALLREVIESLWDQSFDPRRYEIIVVDNCSTDRTFDLIQELQPQSPCALVYYRMPSNRGPASSRNMGARLARAPLMAFTDSDCRVSRQWLAIGCAVMAEAEESVAFLTGSMGDKPGQRVTFFSRCNSGVTNEHASYPTCNAFYRKAAFFDGGGFDEHLCFSDFRKRPVECADTDLAWRLKERGYRNVFNPDLVVYHEVETLTPLNWLLDPFRLFVLPGLVKLHPELRRRLLSAQLFFWGNEWFYLALAGVILAFALHLGCLVLAVPYLYRTARVPGRPFSVAGIPRTIGRVVMLSLRHAVASAGLIYGSVRFGSLVL